MKRWIKVLGAVMVLLIAGAVTSVALVKQYDFNKLKPAIAKMVKDATGRDLVIAGDLDLAVSLSPTLVVSDITFANAAWGEAGDMARLDQLAAKVDLMALLQGRVDIDYLVLDGLKVVLQTDGKGRANWEFETPGSVDLATTPDGALILIPSARDVRLQDVDVTYIDGATGKRLHLMLERADFKADSFISPMHATLAAAYQGVEVDAVVDMGSLSHLVGSSGGAFPVSIEMSAPGLRATIEGSVDQPRAGLDVNASVDVRVTDTATLETLAGMDLPNVDGLKAAAKIQGSGQRYEASAIDVRVGPSDIGGDLAIALSTPRVRLEGKLTSKMMDLDQLFGIEPPTFATDPDGAALFSAEPLPMDAFGAMDADISVLAGQVKLSNLAFSAVKTGIKLNAGKMDVAPISMRFEDADVDAAVHLDTHGKTPVLKISGTFEGLDVDRVLKAMDQGDLLTLPVSGKIDLASSGSSVRHLMAGMNGSLQLAGRDGNINDTTITDLITGLGSKLPWVHDESAGRIICMVAHWPVENGVATAETVLMDTPGFSVAVTGNVDLGGERLHLTVIPQAKTTSLASFAVPFRIKGALSAPSVDVDPADALVGTVGNIFKAPATLLGSILGVNELTPADDPCLKALSGDKTAPTGDAPPKTDSKADAAKAASTKPAAKPDSPSVSPIESLGKALEGLLGK